MEGWKIVLKSAAAAVSSLKKITKTKSKKFSSSFDVETGNYGDWRSWEKIVFAETRFLRFLVTFKNVREVEALKSTSQTSSLLPFKKNFFCKFLRPKHVRMICLPGGWV